MKGVAMKTTLLAVFAVILAGVLYLGCAAPMKSAVPVTDPAQSFELDRLSFRAPSGEGWHFLKEIAPPVEYVLFMKKGAVQPKGFLASVSEVRADNPVTSEKDLSEKVLHLELEAMKNQKRYEILKSDCKHDERFSRIGVLCFTEVRDYQTTETDPVDAITIRGHGYAFVHPDDNRIVGVVEFYERGLSAKMSADTKTMLGQFAGKVKLR
jgi:hypothetical protein